MSSGLNAITLKEIEGNRGVAGRILQVITDLEGRDTCYAP